MTTYLSEALSFVMVALLILWLAVSPHQPISQPGNHCRVDVAPVGQDVFLLPCSKVEPAVYPYVWLNEGQDI
ncbi:hypothetical protein [Mesorhizobium sp. M0571]|uniref:hypothetical protein n=1 Tax=Mesorhizobium sp. M0571 TaxID=2956960 RepID=UPI00333A2BD7